MAPRIEGHERDACTAKIPLGQLQPEGYGPAGENPICIPLGSAKPMTRNT